MKGFHHLIRALGGIMILTTLLVVLARSANAAEFSLVPIRADGNHSITGNTIRLETAGQRVFLDIFIADWDPDLDGQPKVKSWQVEIDPSGYSSGLTGTIAPARVLCTGSADCASTLGPLSQCGAAPNEPTPTCAAGYMDITRKDFIFASVPRLFAVDISSLNYRYAGASQGDSVTDPGQARYVGTLVLDVPPDARGTFNISLTNPLILLDDFSSLEPVDLIPTRIAIACTANADCDDGNACTFDNCLNGNCFHGNFDNVACNDNDACTENDTCFNGICIGTQVGCPVGLLCDPGDGLCKVCLTQADCDDGDACTNDLCVSGARCAHEPNFDSTLFCCDPGGGVTCATSRSALIGDADDNGAVDLADFAVFQRCFGNVPASAACAALDADCDCGVNVDDLAAFDGVMTGP